jgi:two-component system, NtrC family, sensor histidine kinase HydH
MNNDSGKPMQIVSHRKLYLPAYLILGVVLILLVFISISTYQMFNRQRRNAQDMVRRQGLGLLQALESGVHSGLLTHSGDSQAIKHFIMELGQIQDVAYLYILDAHGDLTYHSASDGPQPIAPRPRWPAAGAAIQTREVQDLDGSEIYEIARRYTPANDDVAADHAPGRTVVIGLKMTAFKAARRADLHHAFIMAVIVLALGAGAIFFIYVIQKYHQVNRSLRQTQEYARQVVASLASGLLSIDLQGCVVTHNQPALKLLDIAPEKIEKIDLNDYLDFNAAGIEDTLTNCRPNLDQEILYQTRNQPPRPLAISVTPMADDHRSCRGAVILIRDLSRIKALEAQMRQAEKLAVVGELAAGVAHEIRNPLSSIKGFARFLQKNMAADAREREYTQVIIREVDRINAVVNDLLTLARPMTARWVRTDVAELLDHAVRLVQPDAKANAISLRTCIAPDIQPICADANHLTQALLNLLLNAVHAIGSQGVITVGAENGKHGQWCRIWVEDDGPGIEEEHRAKLFDPFFTTREKGIGLGLAIVQTIVENHGGRIDVASPPPDGNRGSRFTIRLPWAMDRCAPEKEEL